MKKLKLFFACLLMAVLSIGQVWAGSATYSMTPNAETTGSTATSYWTSLTEFTHDGVTWQMNYLNPSSRQTKTNQTNAAAQFRFYNSSAFPGKITKVVITYSALTVSDASKFMFVGGTSAVTATSGGESATWDGTEKTMTWTPASSTNYTYFAFYMNGKCATGSNYLAESDAIVVTYETSGEDPDPVSVTGVTLDKSELEVAVGKTVTLVPTVAPSNATTKTVTWESDDEDVATVDGGVVTGVAEGTATITVKTTDGNKTATCEVTVTAAPAAVNYEKVTAEPADWSGEYILVYEADATNARVWKGADEANNYAEATIATGVIAAPEGAAVLTIAKVAESDPVVYTIQVGTKYIGQTSNSNGIKIQDAAINNSISYNGTDAAVDIVASSAHLRYNSASSSYFRYYKSSSYSSQKKIQLYKKVDGTVKPSAELSYAAADQKKLTKLGDAFTAPTLTNPNNLEGITYASNNTDVAEVANDGSVTIKATGVAVITASFAGNDDYKAGDASYTIGVTTHAGTEADPYVAADAKIAIDAAGTVENAYASGLISNVVTTATNFDAEAGYITFNISADGLTSGQQIQAYHCFNLNSAKFAAVTDVTTGATVVVTGTLKKFNSTYEFDQNCHLVSYTAPAAEKTHIANDQANPYTVAQAITFAADGVTYDLDDYVYVQGVVYDVKSFNDGAMNIFIKDANAENQFELYKCAGINDGSATTPFEALSDVQAGNIVIGYGQLTVFNTTYEFKQGNYLVDLQKPVTGVQLDATAEVEVGSTVNLTATILPSNATGTIVWSVQSGDTYASVENGVVTGIAEGEAVIRATVQGTEIYAECTVTVTPEAAPVSYDYALVTDAAQLQDGLKVIIVAAEADKAAGAAAATYREVVDVERTSNGNYLILDSENMPTEFTLGVLPAAGQYTFNDGDGYMYESAAKSVKVQADPFAWSISIGDGNIATIQATNELRYNSGSPRFTTYASGQQALQLFIKDDGKQAAGLAWSTDAVVLTVGDEFTAPTLTNPNHLTVTIESNNTELATVENNVVSLVANVTGTAKITASFGGDDTYRAASVSYTITVSAAPQPAGTANVVIIAEYDSKFYALTNSISNKTAIAVEITKDGDNIVVTSEEAKTAIQWTRTTEGENTTFQDADDKYLKGTSGGGDLTLADDACNWSWDVTGEYYYIGTRSFIYRESAGGFKNYSTQNAGSQDYSNIAEVRVIDPENIVVVVPTTHTVSYNANGGTLISGEDPIADAQVAEGATVTVAANVYEKDGYIFAGWLYGNGVYNAGETFTMPTEDVELVAQWNVEVASDYVLVTNVNQLQAGDKVIIVAADYNVAAGSAAATFRNVVDIAKTSDKSHLIFGASMPTEFTLGIPADGEYSFNDGDGFMYESAAKSVKVQAESFSWSISIDAEAIATISATNELRYNSTNPRFTTYASGQSALQLYRKPGDAPAFVDVRTGLTEGKYYTICLPKKVTNFRGATIWNLEKRDMAGTEVYLEEAELPFAAGTPFIIQATADKLEVVYEGDATEDAGTNGALVGTLTGLDVEAFAALGGNIYILKDNAIRPRTTGNWLSAQRAYIDYDELDPVASAPGQAPGRQVRRMPMQKDQAQGFESIEASEKPMKLMIDGQMYILRGEKMYDATGRLVK